MTVKTDAPAETFISAFGRIARERTAEALRPALDTALARISVRSGFGRGASYTVHSAVDKHANASACIEPIVGEDGAFDLILSPMSGARAADAAGRLAVHLASALYPSIKREGKTKADARGKERNAWIKALGLTRTAGVWTWADAAYDVLPAMMPETRYAGSKPPVNATAMFAFALTDAAGRSLKERMYLSLKVDGSSAAFMAAVYAGNIKVAGPVKVDKTPEAYHTPKQAKPAEANKKVA